MWRFTDLVRGGETVREVKQKFPETEPVMEKFGLRLSCYDCPFEVAARKAGASCEDLLVAINEVIYKQRGVTA